jgi:hypothetical protein
MSLGKAMIHARKQKSIARTTTHTGDGSVAHPNQILQMPVLVLNASYEPINICGARRAVGDTFVRVSAHPPSDSSALSQEHSPSRSQRVPVLR